MTIKRVVAGREYIYNPVGMDVWDGRTDLEKGDVVVVCKNKAGRPANGVMGHCYVENTAGRFIGLVLCNSLQSEAEYVREVTNEQVKVLPNVGKICLTYLMDTQTKNAEGKLVAEVGLVKWGETGYYPTTYGLQTRSWVDGQNERLGLTWGEAEAMVTCSMFNCWKNFDQHKQTFEGAGKPPIAED